MKIWINGKKIEAEIANNFLKIFFGLSFSKKKNLLFIMPYEYKWSFWMFGVRYKIKIIFISKDKRVVDVKNGTPISFNPKTWKIYKPKHDCKYVLETPLNIKVKVGSKVKWQ